MGASLRDLQLCEFGILKDIKRVCEENHITYYLSCGTLLGAVRHKGFIPWDDDIDIEMPYPDYQRFVAVAQEALGPGYFLQNRDTDPAFCGLFSKVRKNNTTMLSKFEIGIAGHHGVWIDVFPIISLGGSFDYRFRKTCVRICNFSLIDKSHFETDQKWIRSQTNGFLFQLVKLMIKLPRFLRKGIHKLFAGMVFMGHSRKAPRKAHIWTSITYVHPSKVFEGDTKLLSFEGELFPAPPDYEEYLRNAYGDYMQLPPEEKRTSNHGDMIIDLEHSWERYNQKS